MANQPIDFLINNVLVPVLGIIVSAFLAIVGYYVRKFTNSLVDKNSAEKANFETTALDTMTTVKNNMLTYIENLTEAAVFKNATLAETLKKHNGALSEKDQEMLQNLARQFVYNALPDDMKILSGEFMKIIGGQEALDTIIGGFIEKYSQSNKNK